MRARRLSLPSYMMFCWDLPRSILCRKMMATSRLVRSLVVVDSFLSSSLPRPVLYSWMFMLESVL